MTSDFKGTLTEISYGTHFPLNAKNMAVENKYLLSEDSCPLHLTPKFKKGVYWMLGAGALRRPRGMVRGGRWEGGSGWGTRVYLLVDSWQNQYNIVK